MFILFEISHEGNSVMYNRFVFMVFLFWGRNFMEDDRLNNLKEFWDSIQILIYLRHITMSL